jgi:hypothetical protein
MDDQKEKVGFMDKLSQLHKEHGAENQREEEWALRNWRAWGSWFSWGSPIGLGLFFVEIGVFLWLLHLANIIH